ncbi:MAG TPA: MdtA/MuxA family multidrug efflux RND transporter periplasmic adaptor subunit [Stellaceae bacterium]|nr:MdtA/MuxA family multidrug efflux RND transporter periplasmic adaptor subunit [Stellaceae bacterium]
MDELRVEPKHDHRPDQRQPDGARRSRWRPVLWILVVLILAVALAWWIHTRPAPAPSGRFGNGAPMPVVLAPAATGDIRITYNALGTVTPIATVTVITQISGQLTQVGFTEGQEVKKGDFLAQVDPRPYQAALDQAQGTLARDQAALEMARTDLKRYQTLAKQNSIAQQQADDQQFTVYQDEGTVKLDQAQVETAQLNLNYCHIVAPVSGRIGLREVDPGNYIQTGNSTPIAVVTQMKPITVIFTLPEDELPAVMARLHAGAKLAVTAYDRSGVHKLGEGTLAAVDSQIDPTTGTVKLRAEFPNDDEALFPSQFVNAILLIDTLKNTVEIPTAGVQRGEPGTFVYLMKPDNTVTVQKVVLGPQDGERVQVKSGLKVGDRIVVDGADKLREGAKVVVRQETPGAATGASPAAAAPGTASPTGSPGAAKPAANSTTATPGAAPAASPSQPSPPATGQ